MALTAAALRRESPRIERSTYSAPGLAALGVLILLPILAPSTVRAGEGSGPASEERPACARDEAPSPAGEHEPHETAAGEQGATEACELDVPADTRIGAVEIHAGDVFDTDRPDEDRWLFRLANRLHPTTREGVIRTQLLFRPGESFSETRLAESERLLRHRRYIRDSRIQPVRIHDGLVDVDVVTRDVWTLALGVRFGFAGGAGRSALRIEDSNLLGTGKTLALERTSDVDRETTRFLFADPNVLGSRVRLRTVFEDSSDGGARSVEVEKPFESLESRWAAGLSMSTDDRFEPVYSLGNRVGSFRHRSSLFEVRAGRSNGLHDGHTVRWIAGATFEEHLYDGIPDSTGSLPLPEDRTLVYPWLGVERTRDHLATSHHLEHLAGTEDVLVGSHLEARLGFASAALGSDHDYAVFDASSERGWMGDADSKLLLFLGNRLSGRWGAGGPENLLFSASGRLIRSDLGRHRFFALLDGAVGEQLDAANELQLGGDNGLRGYPLRYQSGGSRLLLTLEQRFFTRLYPFRVAHLGAAAFYDLGRTWGPSAARVPNLGWLQDVGVGLRLESSRSDHSVLHFDIAFPLDRDPSIKSVQFLIRVRDTL